MADKPKKPGSITQPADSKNERIAEVSNVNRVVQEMQEKTKQDIKETQYDVENARGIEDVQNSMVKVLSSLNSTVGNIGYGFAKVAASTSKASADVLKSVTEDIKLNKQNTVATALATASPIFGYFAAKFVETDVWKNAKEKMKANISDALGSVTSKFREGFSGLISRARLKGRKERPIKSITSNKGIPKMQHGGYVKKEGLAHLHPAEVVMPIEEVLGRIDKSIGITEELAKSVRRTELHSLARMHTYVASQQKFEKVGLFKGYLRAMKQVHEQYTEPSDIRMLRALLAIQDAIGAQVSSYQQIWQKMLIEHPFFRHVAFALKGLGSVFGAPFRFIYSIFKSRGGYKAHLSKATNPLEAMVENLGKIYAEGMWRLDNIALYTKATAEATRDLSSAFTGKQYKTLEGIPSGIWSFFRGGRSILNWMTKQYFLNREKYGKSKAGTAEKWTREREFFVTTILDKLSTRRRLLKETYGETGFSRLITPGMEQEGIKLNAIPVSEIHIAKFVKKSEEYMNESRNDQQKLLGYTSDMTDVIEAEYTIEKKREKREKRKSLFGMFGLVGGGGLTGILTTLLPVILGGIAAAWGGAKIGQWLDNTFGISKGLNKIWSTFNAAANRLNKEQGQKTQHMLVAAKKGGIKGYAGMQGSKIQTGVGKYNVGKGAFLYEVETGQQDFLTKHLNDYLKYTPDEISRVRTKWIQEGGFPSKHFWQNPITYGKKREGEFLKYLQKEGKAQTAVSRAAALGKYEFQLHNPHLVRKATEQAKSTYTSAKKIAHIEAQKAIVEIKEFEKVIKDQTKKLGLSSKEMGKEISHGITQATTIAHSSIQNISSTVSNAAQKTRETFSEYDRAIVRGDYFNEGF